MLDEACSFAMGVAAARSAAFADWADAEETAFAALIYERALADEAFTAALVAADADLRGVYAFLAESLTSFACSCRGHEHGTMGLALCNFFDREHA